MTKSTPTILIIDNDEGITAALEARLTNEGCACLTASSGAQGLALLRDHDVNLVITDLNMPSGDGVTVVRAVRQQLRIPVIVVTGCQDAYEHELVKMLSLPVMNKPFEFAQLLEMIKRELQLVGSAA